MKLVLACVVALLGTVGAQQAHAAPVTFNFTGTVDFFFVDPFDPFGGAIDFGTSFEGTYTFESTTPDAIPSGNVGSYSNFGAPFGMDLVVGPGLLNVSANEFLNIGVANDIGFGEDFYTVLAQEGIPGGPDEFVSMEMFLDDPTGTAFAGDDLPLVPPDLGLFPFASFFLDGVQIIGGTAFQFQLQGTIDTLTVSVSEPATGALLAICLAALPVFRRRAYLKVM